MKTWRSLVQQSECTRINKVLKEIACFLEKTYPGISNPGLFTGKTGVALFFFYYSRLMKDPYYHDVGEKILRDVFNDINNGFSYHSMAEGLAGVAWTINHLATKGYINWRYVYEIRQLDHYLGKIMIKNIDETNYDYLHGALGPAVYLLSKINSDNNRRKIEEMIFILDKISIKKDSTIIWSSVVDNEKGISGINLGLSHGMASIIYFLLSAYKVKIVTEKVEHMLMGALEYTLQVKNNQLCKNSVYPNWISDGESSGESRMAWCYGDPGIGSVLWQAGRSLNIKELEITALDVLSRSAMRRGLPENGIVDASLCHGSSGLSLIFNRLYQETQREEFYDAASYWLDVIMEQYEMGKELEGFKYWKPGEKGGYIKEYNLLEGISGIGLNLISAVSTIDPGWDACMMLS